MNDNFYVTKSGGVGAGSVTAGTGSFGGGWFGGTANIANNIKGYSETEIEYVTSVEVSVSGSSLHTTTHKKKITVWGKGAKSGDTGNHWHINVLSHSHSISEGSTSTGVWP
jgi:hypothetical protein